jgi:hypothetical protein
MRGDEVAIEAHRIAQRMDPKQMGLDARDLERALVAEGFRIEGDDPSRIVDSALNRNQTLFVRLMPGHWRWLRTEEVAKPAVELSGASLADAAWRVASRIDGSAEGRHYHRFLGGLWDAGTHAKGPNEGSTLRHALDHSALFDKTGRGIYRWRPRA